MSTIARAFENGKAFIPFITCGDPDLETTEQLIYAMERAGTDLIELGIPFSDPTAEGPVIQEANIRSLSAGTTTDKVFDLVQKVRTRSAIPLAFMTYANVIFSYGIEAFAQKAAKVGIDGIILPDVPLEEADEFDVPFAAVGIDRISMIAPTSHERIAAIAQKARGFVYCVSSLGVTGVRSNITTDIASTRKATARYSLRCGIWNIHPRTSAQYGRSKQWRYCRKRHCETLRPIRKRLRALC